MSDTERIYTIYTVLTCTALVLVFCFIIPLLIYCVDYLKKKRKENNSFKYPDPVDPDRKIWTSGTVVYPDGKSKKIGSDAADY